MSFLKSITDNLSKVAASFSEEPLEVKQGPDENALPSFDKLAKKNVNLAKELGIPRSETKEIKKSLADHQIPKDILNEPRVRALLDVIAFSEGTNRDSDNGYGRIVNGKVVNAHQPELIGQRNVTTTDFSKHPEILVQVNENIKSTAAGRYQFIRKTWDSLGLPDFSPQSQDMGAVILLERRGALKALLNDNVDQAILKSNKEWASLPGSPYGQPTRSLEQLKAVYNEALSYYRKEQEIK